MIERVVALAIRREGAEAILSLDVYFMHHGRPGVCASMHACTQNAGTVLSQTAWVVQVFPSNPDSATYSVPLSRVVYIEETDFEETDRDMLPKGPGRPGGKKAKFFGMAPGKECFLKYARQDSLLLDSSNISNSVSDPQAMSETLACSHAVMEIH